MDSYTIIEIAVVNMFHDANHDANHYWRQRYIEGGEQVDEILQIDDLRGMAHDAKRYIATGETVVWRYYETGI